jgi:FixJ family two-component response regulator
MDVIKRAENAGSPVNVIVVGTNLDINFYLTALERGAFDFVLPPFEHEALDFIVQSALQNARLRRHARERSTMD